MLGELLEPSAAPASASASTGSSRGGTRRSSSAASSSSPTRATDEVTITGTSGPRRPRHGSARGLPRGLVDEVGLRQREHPRQRRQPRVVLRELALDRRVVVDRVGAVERVEVEHVDEQPRALDVGEELVAEPGAVARALDQPRDVGDHELAVVGLERARAPARAS